MITEVGVYGSKIPVLNGLGVAAHPYAPLKEGMLVYQRSRNDMMQPDEVRKSSFVFDWENVYYFIHLEDNMIDWVDSSPLLTKPIYIDQAYSEESYHDDYKRSGVPIQFVLSPLKQYGCQVLTTIAYGDVNGNNELGVNFLKFKCDYLNALKNNIPDIQFPLDNYVSVETHTRHNVLTRTSMFVLDEVIRHRYDNNPDGPKG